ncbi:MULTISPECIES: DUF1365 domain-containing protein [unclassified Amycolatopsis]|uniref:DUF1365 domain-containing protein n=1 Tax=unclassified Amycolatopsis TaxID=2618356 RepID=UPI0028764494|nr:MULTISPECIES: DUF1365 domain-containing protein [unclassified Amycolatopsis]MDS0140523.1 DUF1365 domain-containing protein [Amycolatopsis sp. 505]MDS0148623.1 DUF1365 domain-containing protein [Amycolatopsis sp. CM201R]
MVTNALYDATVAHVRRIDPPHAFAHRVYLWRVDLDDLPRLPWWLRPFARFDRRDHFVATDPRGIREKLDAWLAERGVDLRGGKVVMLAAARVLGYVFNPISVYWCHDPGGELACVVAEVHNTYGGRHAYLLHPDDAGRARAAKEFYVSPFQQMDGEYRMRLPRPEALLDLTVALRRENTTPLVATLRGVRRPVNPRWLARLVLARPLLPQRVSALIRRHGVALWLRKAAVVPRTPQNAGGQLHG